MIPKNSHQEGGFETVFRAGFLNLLIGVAALTLGALLEIPPLPIKKSLAFVIFLILIIIYAGLLSWSAFALISAKKEKKLATMGPYSLFRHPMYAGIILLVNPALAVLLRSWVLLEACVLVYFIWKHFAQKEEKQLLKTFGNEYKEYAQKTGCLFPRTC